MKHLLLSLALLFSLTACQDKKNDAKAQAAHDAMIVAKAKAEVLAKIQANKAQETTKNAKLAPLGVSMKNGIIQIDTNKTKAYFSTLNTQMEMQMKQISDDLQKGIIETKEAGISINNEHINIDLNKTQNLLENWGKKIQVFVKTFDDIAQDIEDNTSKGN